MVKSKVLVVGDLMLDEFVYGSVTRISPEAPVPILKINETRRYIGGCGNVAANLKSLGVDVCICAAVGDDEPGGYIRSKLRTDSIQDMTQTSSTDTIVKTRFVSSTNSHMLRVDSEKPYHSRTSAAAAEYINENAEDLFAVVISDYDKGTLDSVGIADLIRTAKSNGVKAFVDSKRTDYAVFTGAYVYKPNLSEFQRAVGHTVDVGFGLEDQIRDLGTDFLRAYDIDNMVVTLGSEGAALVGKDGTFSMARPDRVLNVYDVSGAGDTALAALVASCIRGAQLKDSLKYANRAAGLVVQKSGTAVVSSEEVFCTETAGEPRAKKVGFTNGCFDCCHYGHIHSLKQAKSLCDRLVVGVNSDEWIRKHKGPGRPIQDEKTRVEVLKSFSFVDEVIVFDDDTALQVVKKVRPDIIMKQGYSMDKWPEAQYVKSYGGEVVFLDKVEGYSTTEMEKRVKEQA